ncbi:uncharacterized protein LOC135487776 [Lineus longissimus]|uniref:uncharacterized protein LOC135487776 n=1 Tax=Lineus longissimus TaxID=88925 RepID=UPI002B4C7E93
MSFVPPVIDCSPCSAANPDFDPNTPESKELAAEIHKAFTEVGFAYLTGHGITDEELEKIWSISEQFFNLPIEEKRKAERAKSGGAIGWTPMAEEVISGEAGDHADYKECYNYIPHHADFEGTRDQPVEWPGDTVLPNFKKLNNEMFHRINTLFINFLKLLPNALKLKDPDAFLKMHTKIGGPGSFCTLRLITYPPIGDDVTEGKRCGLHSDYGTLSFMFQDSVGGLELKTKDGEWVNGEPKEGAIIVIPCDSLGFQTSDQYRGVKHRLGLPAKTDLRRKQTRRSMVFFGVPDTDASIAPLDGSDMFPQKSFGDYCLEEMKAIY